MLCTSSVVTLRGVCRDRLKSQEGSCNCILLHAIHTHSYTQMGIALPLFDTHPTGSSNHTSPIMKRLAWD